jgi:hypothetical protein
MDALSLGSLGKHIHALAFHNTHFLSEGYLLQVAEQSY